MYVPGESNGELPKYMLPKLNARLIRSVAKYFAHLPYRLSSTCRLKKFLRKSGFIREKNDGKVFDRTIEYDNEACSAPSLTYNQHAPLLYRMIVRKTRDGGLTIGMLRASLRLLGLPTSQPPPSVVPYPNSKSLSRRRGSVSRSSDDIGEARRVPLVSCRGRCRAGGRVVGAGIRTDPTSY